MYKSIYKSPKTFSNIVMTSDGNFLTGLWFERAPNKQKNNCNYEEKKLKIFDEVKLWLDIYFNGKNPSFIPEYKISGITQFEKEVYDILVKIPYGKTLTYDLIAKQIAKKRGINKMSAQAVGRAIGKNPICIIIPCHRVVGKDGSLTGYNGGIKNKIELLKLEQNDMSNFYVSKKGNKL